MNPSLRVLVTGGAGFIGSHVCEALLAGGHEVIAVDDLSAGSTQNLPDGIRFAQVDIRSPDLRGVIEDARPEIVCHLAAQPAVRPSVEDPVRDASVNIVGSVNLLETAVEVGGVGKLIYAASGGTLYGEPKHLPVVETAAEGAIATSPYGISKQTVDRYLRYYRAHHDLASCQLALANVYGPRQDPLGEGGVVAIFARQMLDGERPTIFGDGRQTRDFVYVTDVARAFLAAIHADAADAAGASLINIGTGTGTTVDAIFDLVARATGFRGAPDHRPAREEELRHISLDAGRAAATLDWRPEVSLDVGIDATVGWMRGRP